MENWIRRAASAIAWRLRCQWAVLRAGPRSKAVLASGPLRKLLIVCYGNINRSPYAAALLGMRLGPGYEVRSSGFHPTIDRPSQAPHVAASLQSGVDLRRHRSARLTVGDLASADAIILMDRHNWQALCQLGADPKKLVWLGALDGDAEIADPYGKPEEEARQLMHRVHRCTEALAAAILERQNSPAG